MSKTVQQFEQRQKENTLHALADLPPEPFPGAEAVKLGEELEEEGPQFPTEVDCPLEPTAGFVVMVRERRATVTPGGILLPPEQAQDRAMEDQVKALEEMAKPELPCVCVAVGPGIDNIHTPCKIGDRVLTAGPCYSKFAGEWFDYEILAFSAITAVLPVPEED